MSSNECRGLRAGTPVVEVLEPGEASRNLEHEAIREQRPDTFQFLALVFNLVSRGYVIELKSSGKSSYHATVRNQLDLIVGDIQFRDPQDEPNEFAQGISYGSHNSDPQYAPDITFKLVMSSI